MFAIFLLASLNAGNGVAPTVLLPLLGGVLMGAVFTGTCFLERKRQQKLFGDH
ncbi:hypothetical protein [Streptomyces sp. NPDC047071]|uniref:hypothetical protein n=1 Tax=Streptomyces sp. NPDC047071 TaxID=3154808 RepID=UPI0034541DDC